MKYNCIANILIRMEIFLATFQQGVDPLAF
jgi:hypothetical protein